MDNKKVNLMTRKFYNLFFIALLIVGGFLFLVAAKKSLAACRDVCDPTGCREVCDTATTGGQTTTGGGTPQTAGPATQMPNFSGIQSVQDLFTKIVAFLMPLAMIFASLMIVWSGFLFVTAQGDPAKITKAKQNFIWTVTGVAVVLASGAIVDYVSGLLGGTSTGAGSTLMTKITNIIKNDIIPFLFVLVTLYFIWGVVTYVRAAGDQTAIETGKKHMIWGIVGMTIMMSAWGIVRLIASGVQ